MYQGQKDGTTSLDQQEQEATITALIKLHHGGFWNRNPNPDYVSGTVTEVGYSLSDIYPQFVWRLVENLGCTNVCKVHFIDAKGTTSVLSDHSSEIELIKLLFLHREAHLFCEHSNRQGEEGMESNVSHQLMSHEQRSSGTKTSNDATPTHIQSHEKNEAQLEYESDVNGYGSLVDVELCANNDEIIEARSNIRDDKSRSLRGELEPQLVQELFAKDAALIDNNSDYRDTSDLGSISSSDCEDDRGKKKMKYPVFNPKSKPKEINFELSQMFADSQEFKEALDNYACCQGYDIGYFKNHRDMVGAKCKSGDCQWRIWASKMQGEMTFQVKSLINVHTCCKTNKCSRLTSKWLAKHYMHRIRTTPNLKLRELRDTIKDEFNVEVTLKMCSRAWKRATEVILQSYEYIEPLLLRTKSGRKRILRRKEVDEPTNQTRVSRKGGQITCSKCGMRGHNRRFCRQPSCGTNSSQQQVFGHKGDSYPREMHGYEVCIDPSRRQHSNVPAIVSYPMQTEITAPPTQESTRRVT